MGRTAELDCTTDTPYVENRAEWGPLERLGIPSAYLDVPVIRRTTYETVDSFWELPADLVAESVQLDVSVRDIRASRKQPSVRYVKPASEVKMIQISSSEEDEEEEQYPAAVARTEFEATLKRRRLEAQDDSTSMEV